MPVGPSEVLVIVGVVLLIVICGSGVTDGLTGRGNRKDSE
jgi:hypothetical protein